jgi:hypothetical protein
MLNSQFVALRVASCSDVTYVLSHCWILLVCHTYGLPHLGDPARFLVLLSSSTSVADVLFVSQSWVSLCMSDPSVSVFLTGWDQVVTDPACPPCFGPLG